MLIFHAEFLFGHHYHGDRNDQKVDAGVVLPFQRQVKLPNPSFEVPSCVSVRCVLGKSALNLLFRVEDTWTWL